jgi:uncharacterized membrane protein YqhA
MPPFKPASLIGILLKLIAFVAVVVIILLAIGIEYFAITETFSDLAKVAAGDAGGDDILKKVLKSLDTALLGVIFFSIAAALFELFVQEIDNLPEWLIVRNLDDLKAMMIKMIIVVAAISFTGKIITWNGEPEILQYGVGLAAVIFGLSYFLLVKERSKEDK